MPPDPHPSPINAPADLAIKIVDTILIDGSCSNPDEYLELTAVVGTETEAELIGQLRQLAREVGSQCATAAALTNPRTVAKHVTATGRFLRSMLKQLRALRHHRHGPVQRIRVHRGTQVPAQPNSQLTCSDALLDELFLGGVAHLKAIGDHCTKERLYLSGFSEAELAGQLAGVRPGPDRTSWISKFEDLENTVLVLCCDFRAKVVLSERKERVILVRDTCDQQVVESSPPKRKIVQPRTGCAIAVNVEKASRPDHDFSR